MSRFDTDRLRITLSSVAGVALGGIVYVLILFDFRGDPGRTAVGLGYASRFFETQAQAFLDGHLYLPPRSMGIEGFVVHHHTYMYFGPFPALLRLPVMLVTHDFDGRMSLVSMLLAWTVYAVMAARLTWLVRRCLVGDRPVTRTEAALALVFLVLVTGGTTLTFDASLPWAYHEVYVWQAALVVAAAYWLVRLALEPTVVGVRWLALICLATVLTRTPGGLGVCVGAIALACWMRFGSSFADRRRLYVWVLLAGLVPLLVGVAYNVVKFDHPYLFPLQDQVWTSVNAHRREALRVNGGTITGPQFFVTSLVNYFSPTGIRFVGYFPWITLPGSDARAVGSVVIDQSYRTGSVTAFMPLLLLMSIASLAVLLRPTRRLPRGLGVRALRVPALATVVMTGGVMGYGYLATRYTSEFVPALVVLGAVTLWALVAPLALRARAVAVPVLGVLVLGTAFSVLAQSAIGYSTAAVSYRGDPLDSYLLRQDRLSGGPGSSYAAGISASSSLPAGGQADDLHVRGRCDGLYLNTGDSNEPWVVVEERSRVLQLSYPARLRPTRVVLFRVHGQHERRVVLDHGRRGRSRLRIVNETGSYNGPLFDLAPHQVLRVGLRTDPTIGYLELSSSPGGFVGYIPLQEWDPGWVSRIGSVTVPFTTTPTRLSSGLVVQRADGLAPPVCTQLARHNQVALQAAQ